MTKIVVTIAGDSGDGIQLLGNFFTSSIALENYDLNTLPDFPAEIRAPAGTVNGVSGFQIQYGSEEILTAGNKSDVFIAFNAAALKKYFRTLKPNGILIYDPSGFDVRNCKLAKFDIAELEKMSNRKLEVDFSKMTRDALANFDITVKEKDKNKNIFALGLLAFGINTDIEFPRKALSKKFKGDIFKTMDVCLQKGYHYAETIEFSIDHIDSQPSINNENQKSITGNKAIALAIAAAPKIFGRNILYGGYPITPASDILHELAKHNFKELIVKQAEDEIAAASLALGAAFGGHIGITASSGPGIDLKQEVVGLAHMAEIPLLIIDVQRAGPSTGMPTKVEQSDLNAVLKGRHGDCPVPVLAIKSPATAFHTTIQAIEMMIKFQTPVFLLSDALIANGSELWNLEELPNHQIEFKNLDSPHSRSDKLVRPWINLGNEGINYILGGLEKDYQTGSISYHGINHENMTKMRLQKVLNISNEIPKCTLEDGSSKDGTLILSWGSTFGAVKEAFLSVKDHIPNLAHLHLDWIFPFPKNFLEIIKSYDKIVVPELNDGQFADYLSSYYRNPIIKVNKVQGAPFYEEELIEELKKICL